MRKVLSSKASENTFQTPPNCSNTTYDTFIQIVLYDRVELVGGNENWLSIVDEYSELVKNDEQAEILVLRKEFARVNNKLGVIQLVVDSLAIKYNPELCQILTSQGFRIKYSEETIYDDLKRTVTLAKQFVIKRDEIRKELSELVSDKQPTNHDFDARLSALSKFQGYKIDRFTDTISQYIAINNQYEQHIAQLEAQINKPN